MEKESKTKRRPLTDEEKNYSEKAVKNIEEGLNDSKVTLEFVEFQLNKLLDFNYRLEKKKLQQQQKSIKGKIEADQKLLEITKDQLKNGVEVREEKKENKG